MRAKRNHYKELELSTIFVLIANIILFVFFLIAAANGIGWLKLVLFIVTLLMALLSLLLLYFNGELTRQRSLWLTTSFAAIAVCVLIAFIINYPSPDPYAATKPTTIETTAPTVATETIIPTTT